MELKPGFVCWLHLCVLVCFVSVEEIESFEVVRRSAAPEREPVDYPDYLLGVRYDEYPMIVPKKRAALLLDRLMVALQKAIEDEEVSKIQTPATKTTYSKNDDVRSMDLQRRGHQGSLAGQQKGRVYWRCYFNAVTCFK